MYLGHSAFILPANTPPKDGKTGCSGSTMARSSAGRWLGALLFFIAAASTRVLVIETLSPDGRIEDPLARIGVAVVEITCVAIGLVFLFWHRSPRLRHVATNAMVAGISLTILGLALETILRLHPIGVLLPPRRYHIPLLQPRGDRGFALRPHLDLRVPIGRDEVRIVTNAKGLRVPAGGARLVPGGTRIALAGDSFTFGEWAHDYEHTFAGVLDSRLPDCEILNFGVPSYGLLETQDLIASDILPLAPDWIVIVVFTGNDFSDTYLGRERYRLESGTAVWDPAQVEAKLGPRAVQLPPPPARQFLNSSRLWTFCTLSVGAIRSRRGSTPPADFLLAEYPLEFNYWSRVDATPHWGAAVEAVETALDAILLACGGTRLAIVALPHAAQVHARAARGPGFDIRLPQAHLEEFARKRGVPYLDLLPGMRRHAILTGARLYCRNDPHLDDTGHLVVGLALASFLRSCIEPPHDASFTTRR